MPSWLSLPARASWPASELLPKLSVQVKAKTWRYLWLNRYPSCLALGGCIASRLLPPFLFLSFLSPKVNRYIHGRCAEGGTIAAQLA